LQFFWPIFIYQDEELIFLMIFEHINCNKKKMKKKVIGKSDHNYEENKNRYLRKKLKIEVFFLEFLNINE
jgi:hypothetical protein